LVVVAKVLDWGQVGCKPRDDPSDKGTGGLRDDLLPGNALTSKESLPNPEGAVTVLFSGCSALNAVDPNAWLTDTLARIPDDKITKVDDLLPWRWNG
jgi:IS66 C-terminal element